jgi:branched-chain amino acid transport system substrate-binding protein
MKGKMTWFKIVMVLAVLFVAISQAPAGETYKTAISLAITGATSDAGNPYAKGVEDWFKYVNDTKMLGDDTVDCTIRDDQYKTDVTKRNFEDFLDMGIVFYLNYSTGSTLALKQDFDEEQMPTIPASYHAGNTEGSSYIFLPIASYSAQFIGLGEYVANNHKEGKAKVALFIHPSAFGRGPVDDFNKAVAAGMNVEVVEVVEHGTDLDNTAMLQRLASKSVQYVICQTVQSPVAVMLKDAERLGMTAKTFGEAGKMTFLGAHYTGGNDLIALAGPATEGFHWITSFIVTSEEGPGKDFQLELAAKYGRDEKTANSHNYAAGMVAAQIAGEVMVRAKNKGKAITKETLYEEMLAMNGDNAFNSKFTVGPVTFSMTDKEGVDTLQIFSVQGGTFKSVGEPFVPEYVGKMK